MILKKNNVERVAISDKAVAALDRMGFEAVQPGEKADFSANTKGVQQGKSLDGMNTSELKTVAKERGIDGYSSLSKADLLDLLKEGAKNGDNESGEAKSTNE